MNVCPVCRGPAGAGRLAVRQIGETTRHGIPLVLSMSVTPYQEGAFSGLCSRCAFRIERGRWVAWVLSLVPMVAVLVFAAVKENGVLGTAGLVLGILAMRGIFYSWLDAMVWGQGVVDALGLPPGVHYTMPSSILSVVLRSLIAPFCFVLLVAVVMAAVSPAG